eukprot:12822432-Alexandrium_andersonii.AAC.1
MACGLAKPIKVLGGGIGEDLQGVVVDFGDEREGSGHQGNRRGKGKRGVPHTGRTKECRNGYGGACACAYVCVCVCEAKVRARRTRACALLRWLSQ